jgi:GT2 family glycosyltransferase
LAISGSRAASARTTPDCDSFAECVIGVVVVAFNSDDVLQSCLDSLKRAAAVAADETGISPRTVVVDNASSRPVGPGEDVAVVRLPSNVGFARAANIGARELGTVEYLLFLNPDARLEPTALVELLAAFDEETAIAGPLLVGEDGAERPSERPFHSVHREFVRQLVPFALDRRERVGEARCLTGACLLVDAAFFREVGGFDEAVRMYLEDVELCWMAHQRGRRVMHVTRARCLHDLGGSTNGENFARSNALYLTLLAARVEFVRRRSGSFGAAGMRAAIACGALPRAVVRAGSAARRRELEVAWWAIRSGRPPAWIADSRP